MATHTSVPAPIHDNTIGGLAIAAIGIGLFAIVLCWFPFLGVLAIPIAVIALIIALIGFFIARARGGVATMLPIVAVSVAVLAVIITFFCLGGSFHGMRQGLQHPAGQSMPSAAK
ncbi:MAG TPA: hypothetical protein VFE47_01550 [Tepidisphaeraceae bacterium]|jgi:hypothetical protein|nr:hypothetical protein [Tepidisphaeraceae bacterium]